MKQIDILEVTSEVIYKTAEDCVNELMLTHGTQARNDTEAGWVVLQSTDVILLVDNSYNSLEPVSVTASTRFTFETEEEAYSFFDTLINALLRS